MAGGRRDRGLYDGGSVQIARMWLEVAECYCTQCGSPDRFNVGNSVPRLVNQNIRGL